MTGVELYLLRLKVREVLATRAPGVFVKIEKMKNRNSSQMVCSDTDIVIEGFPRSANSFAVRAFRSVQAQPVRVATHVHHAVNVIRGVALEKPVLVLVRSPRDAAVSLAALDYEVRRRANNAFRFGERDIIKLLTYYARRWTRFYRAVLPCWSSVVMADFIEVTGSLGTIISRVNERYDTSFRLFEHSVENQSLIFQKGEYHLSPSDLRREFKSSIVPLLEENRVRFAMNEANGLYVGIRERISDERGYGNDY